MQFYIEEDAAMLLEPGRGGGGTVFVTDGRLRDEAAFLGAGCLRGCLHGWSWPTTDRSAEAGDEGDRARSAGMIKIQDPRTKEFQRSKSECSNAD